MDDAHDGPYAREPQIEDLIRLAQALNEHGVRYVLIGGFAVIAHGGARTTKDIDLLIDAGPENVARVRSALQILEDKAVNDVADDDLTRYSVVRVADEIVVDLMAKACGVDYADASRDAIEVRFGDVLIAVASARTLIRTKNTMRRTATSCRWSSMKPTGGANVKPDERLQPPAHAKGVDQHCVARAETGMEARRRDRAAQEDRAARGEFPAKSSPSQLFNYSIGYCWNVANWVERRANLEWCLGVLFGKGYQSRFTNWSAAWRQTGGIRFARRAAIGSSITRRSRVQSRSPARQALTCRVAP